MIDRVVLQFTAFDVVYITKQLKALQLPCILEFHVHHSWSKFFLLNKQQCKSSGQWPGLMNAVGTLKGHGKTCVSPNNCLCLLKEASTTLSVLLSQILPSRKNSQCNDRQRKIHRQCHAFPHIHPMSLPAQQEVFSEIEDSSRIRKGSKTFNMPTDFQENPYYLLNGVLVC